MLVDYLHVPADKPWYNFEMIIYLNTGSLGPWKLIVFREINYWIPLQNSLMTSTPHDEKILDLVKAC